MSSENFVKFWVAVTSKKGAKERAQRVLNAISKYNPKSKKVLELGVGIGTVLRFFQKYELCGLDVLNNALRICKKKFPKASFHLSSMHNFKISKKFDVIFSVYDTINFLSNFNQWKSAFSNISKHLNEDGLFIFDMYTEKALKDFKRSTHNIHKYSFGYTYDKPIIRKNDLNWDYRVFEKTKNGNYKVHKYKWKEKIFPASKVKHELLKKFKILESYYFDKKRRILFVCRKK